MSDSEKYMTIFLKKNCEGDKMYKGLWKLTERYTERETGVSVYLATLILLWTALAIFAGVFVCAAEKKDIVKCLADIVCTGGICRHHIWIMRRDILSL